MNTAPTVASMLPPRIRAWTYALLGLGVPVLFAANEIYDLGPWVALVGIATTSGGFGLALSNTRDAPSPPVSPQVAAHVAAIARRAGAD